MINYISIKSVLTKISKAVRNESNPTELLSYALEAYRDLDPPMQFEEKAKLFQVDNHKVQLDSDIKVINSASYLMCKPTADECAECLDIVSGEAQEEFNLTDSTNPCAGNYAIAHKLFLASSYYNNNYQPMRYIGNNKYACTNCINRFCRKCGESFSVDHNKVMWTSFKEGNVCLIYDTEIRDDDDNFLIIDSEVVKRYLAYYAEYMHFQNRAYTKEQGVLGLLDRLESKVNIFYLKALGEIRLIGVDREAIREITVNRYNANFFMYLPNNYRSKYEEYPLENLY